MKCQLDKHDDGHSGRGGGSTGFDIHAHSRNVDCGGRGFLLTFGLYFGDNKRFQEGMSGATCLAVVASEEGVANKQRRMTTPSLSPLCRKVTPHHRHGGRAVRGCMSRKVKKKKMQATRMPGGERGTKEGGGYQVDHAGTKGHFNFHQGFAAVCEEILNLHGGASGEGGELGLVQ